MTTETQKEHDPVNHPTHYTNHPSGIECITIAERLGFLLGNAFKYIFRSGSKYDELEDLKKANYYVNTVIGSDTKRDFLPPLSLSDRFFTIKFLLQIIEAEPLQFKLKIYCCYVRILHLRVEPSASIYLSCIDIIECLKLRIAELEHERKT
jgi:hypothetical protein